MPPAPQSQPQGDNSLAPLWIAILLFLALGLIWYLGHAYIVAFVFKVKLLQAEVIRLFTDRMETVIPFLRDANTAVVSYQQMADVSATIGRYSRYPIMLVLLICAIMLFFHDVTTRFRHTYSMKTLASSEKDHWPQIKSVLKTDLVAQDIDDGAWAMSMAPMHFAKKYRLLQEEPTPITEPTLKRKVRRTVSVIPGRAKEIFTLQLGRYWDGVEHLPPHLRALFAIFAARINRDREGAYALLKQIAESSDDLKALNFNGADKLLRKHLQTKLVAEILQRHAFVLTVMASMLERARHDGVIATAEFIWLKPVDRSLWFMLNNVGRQTAFVEVAGPFSHWLAEKEFGAKIMVPMVDGAVEALEGAIKDILYVPDEAG